MAKLIRGIVAVFWLTASLFLGFMAYVVLQTENDPRKLWGWLTLCALTFVSATFLAYNVIFSGADDSAQPETAK